MNVEIPFAPRRASGRSVRTMTIITSAVPPLVAHALVPDSTHWSPARSARAESDAASEPDSGSESAKPASSSPRAIGLSQRSFWRGVPGPHNRGGGDAVWVEYAGGGPGWAAGETSEGDG